MVWDDINRVDSAEEYRKAHLTGSRALYFAQCSEENETWLPLLEKAYAKAHGDFTSIDGGFTGEAIEDLTGGVTTEIYSTDILNRDDFWRNELLHVGQEFLFGCATGFFANWLDTSGQPREREGISEGHAYSIMDAKEIKGQRLLKLRNPWGKKEWTGRWSDGSSEWTPEWMQLLDHKFGNDGIFWISYEDLLKKYQHFDRTRIFGPEWNVTQSWTSLNVSWSAEYHSTKFSLTLAEKTRVVIVLAQLDDVYFGGLEGGYGFDLQFRLESDKKEDENDYIVRSNGNYAMARSVSTDIELEAGNYSVLMKITATRNTDSEHVEDVLPIYTTRREKLIQMGLSYDLAHAKAVEVETEAERKDRKAKVKERRAKTHEKAKQRAKIQAEKDWKREKKEHDLNRRRAARKNHWRERKNRVNINGQNGEIDTRVARREDPFNGEGEPYKPTLDFDRGDVYVNGNAEASIPSQEEPPTEPDQEVKATGEVSVDKVVESLEDVVKIADAETQPVLSLSNEKLSQSADAPTSTDGASGGEQPPAPVQVDGSTVVVDVRPLSSSPPRSRPENEPPNGVPEISHGLRDLHLRGGTIANPSHGLQRSETFDSTAVFVGIGSATDEPDRDESRRNSLNLPPANGGHPGRSENGDVSDADSFPPFDWDSELDFSGNEISSSDDTNASSIVERRRIPRYRPPFIRRGGRRRRSRSPPLGLPPPPVPYIEKGEDVDDDDGPEETWNAVCVVGLRVYSTLKGDGVKLKVLKPSGFSDDEGDKKKEKGTGKGEDAEGILDPDDISKGAVAVQPESTGAVVEGEGGTQAKIADNMKLGSRPGPASVVKSNDRGRRARKGCINVVNR